jgi:hypothetical protein
VLVESESIHEESPSVQLSPKHEDAEKSIYGSDIVESEDISHEFAGDKKISLEEKRQIENQPDEYFPTDDEIIESQDIGPKSPSLQLSPQHEGAVPHEFVDNKKLSLEEKRQILTDNKQTMEVLVESESIEENAPDRQIISPTKESHKQTTPHSEDDFILESPLKEPISPTKESHEQTSSQFKDDFIVESESIDSSREKEQISPTKESHERVISTSDKDFIVESESIEESYREITSPTEKVGSHKQATPSSEDQFIVESSREIISPTKESHKQEISSSEDQYLVESQSIEDSYREKEPISPTKGSHERTIYSPDKDFIVESQSIEESPHELVSPTKESESRKQEISSSDKDFIVESQLIEESPKEHELVSPTKESHKHITPRSEDDFIRESPRELISPTKKTESIAESDVISNKSLDQRFSPRSEHFVEEISISSTKSGTLGHDDMFVENEELLTDESRGSQQASSTRSQLEETRQPYSVEKADIRTKLHEREIEDYQSLPSEMSSRMDDKAEDRSDKLGIGTIIAGAVFLGAKAVGEKAIELGEKIGDTIKEQLAEQSPERLDQVWDLFLSKIILLFFSLMKSRSKLQERKLIQTFRVVHLLLKVVIKKLNAEDSKLVWKAQLSLLLDVHQSRLVNLKIK